MSENRYVLCSVNTLQRQGDSIPVSVGTISQQSWLRLNSQCTRIHKSCWKGLNILIDFNTLWETSTLAGYRVIFNQIPLQLICDYCMAHVFFFYHTKLTQRPLDLGNRKSKQWGQFLQVSVQMSSISSGTRRPRLQQGCRRQCNQGTCSLRVSISTQSECLWTSPSNNGKALLPRN